MGFIYKIVNDVNDKVYIGQTTYTLERRWQQHISKSKTNNSLLYREMRRIGLSHFKMELVEKCDDSALDKKEIYYIDKFKSYYNGYNSTLGGHGGAKYDLDDDIVINMYKNNYGMHYIAEYFGCNLIVIKSLLIKNNIELRNYNNESISVTMLSKEYTPLLKFNSKKEAWRWLVNNYRNTMKDSEAYTYIGRACKYGNTAFGYKWIYSDDIDINDENTLIKNRVIQEFNKRNKPKEEQLKVSESLRNPEKNINRKKAGRPSIKCEINYKNKTYRFNKLYEAAEFICNELGENVISEKQLRHRADAMRRAADNGSKYKGFEVRIIE